VRHRFESAACFASTKAQQLTLYMYACMCTLVPSVCGAASNLLAPAAAKEEREHAHLSACLRTCLQGLLLKRHFTLTGTYYASACLRTYLQGLLLKRHSQALTMYSKCLFTHMSARPAHICKASSSRGTHADMLQTPAR